MGVRGAGRNDDTLYTGGSISNTQANFVDGPGKPTPVGSYPANGFGLYDMAGDVWQWTQDCYSRIYETTPTDGSASIGGDCSRCVLPGGSWGVSPLALRSAFRTSYGTGYRVNLIGFRVARAL